MSLKHKPLLLSLSLLSLAACTSGDYIEEVVDGQYWQRAHTAESIYMQGAKAQQLLNRSIARCVVELREYERLGMVRNAIPADINGRVLDPDQTTLDEWDTPERDGELFMEHADYQDFEGCMLEKGWERVKYLPYDVEKRSRQAYLDAQSEYNYQSRYGRLTVKPMEIPTSQNSGDFGDLNKD